MPKEYKIIIQKYKHEFMFIGANGKHNKMQHITTGKKISFSCTPSDRNAVRNFERDLQKVIMGVYEPSPVYVP